MEYTLRTEYLTQILNTPKLTVLFDDMIGYIILGTLFSSNFFRFSRVFLVFLKHFRRCQQAHGAKTDVNFPTQGTLFISLPQWQDYLPSGVWT